MLDGLAHADEEVRLSASEELKRVTGEYFGYHYDLPKREREEARLKWLKWWEERRQAPLPQARCDPGSRAPDGDAAAARSAKDVSYPGG